MMKVQFLTILIVILVVFAIFADAQRQQQQQQQQHNGKRKKPQQQQQQQQQVGRPNKKQPRPRPINGGAGGAGTSHKVVKKPKPTMQKKKKQNKKQDSKKSKYINKQIPNLGQIRGRTFKSDLSGKVIMQFLDIPYAKSPTGSLRFKPPVPAAPWKDVLNAYLPHPGCPSLQEFEKFELLAENEIDIEDCLRLTVSTKSFTTSSPVMVYIHGDFLYDGSSVEAAPGYLLEEDVVLVSVRYRLGPFGFLSTLTDDIPGNAAVYDIILALRWIQENIDAFGGDPSSVTLFGQVGGAAIINLLTMSPKVPEGLFHRVIYQSGSALSPAFITSNPVPATKDIARYAGCKNLNKIESINKCLRKLNATALLDAFNSHGDARATLGVGAYGGVQFVIGGPSGILPEHPGKLLAANKFKAYPTLGGSVKNGGTFILKDVYFDNFNETIIDDKLNGLDYINHIINQTNGADPTGAWVKFAEEDIFTADEIKNGSFYKMTPGLIDMCSTISFKNPVLLALQANSRKLPNSTYLYTFDYEGDTNRYASTEDDSSGTMPFELGVSLTDDNLYLFPWPRYNVLNSNRDIKIVKRMIALWTSFATTGVPKAPGVPAWPAMSDETGPYVKLDKTITFGDNYLDEYHIAVTESKIGHNLVNQDFFDSLVEIPEDENKDKDGNGEKKKGDGNDDDEEEQENEGRGSNIVFIAKRTKRT